MVDLPFVPRFDFCGFDERVMKYSVGKRNILRVLNNRKNLSAVGMFGLIRRVAGRRVVYRSLRALIVSLMRVRRKRVKRRVLTIRM